MLTLAQVADDVFHHHDGTIDDEAKIDCAETHEVSAQAQLNHAGHGKEHRKRNDERDNDCSTPIPQKRKEHDNDEQRTFGEILLHRLNCAVHKIAAVIDGFDDHSGWQLGLDIDELG